ncbi:hypothetical protein COU19_02360 [Candidatus Kaiserbacteria bacterium CG10_big_fil_rev_8_21_14_0_10_56_12]|uniref:SIMPL domain-containing protein n=1 Tax=Candidatus Kaiserbacteria bacterium CG10_big_fil_rev_8_21_14_0_10_56_12 TaxID=1974611 RepID=A0A2H0U9M2_9BACT|nr:MAG: hypothetical protein COU19_02360 [Candidatus Kaiserbacteria bacterium CG10_big_fil_rev_8_21_14_0_10_56_12]
MNNDSLNSLFASRAMRVAATASVIFLAVFLLAQTISVMKNTDRASNPATDVITVSGEGQATLSPDIARVSFSVQNTAETVAAAQEATTKQANAAIEFVKGQDVAEKDIKTLAYTVTPQYSYPNPCPPGTLCPAYRTPKITGYQVSETVEAKIRDLDKVGAVLAGLGKLEVQNISGPAFALDDATAGYDAARADAIKNAKAKAAKLADELGVSLGKIVNFNETSGNYPGPMMYGLGGAMETKATASPNVPAGENTYSASVSITYEIR